MADGACPHCLRVIALTAKKRRRRHTDPSTGADCTGSMVYVGEAGDVDLAALPVINVPDVSVDHCESQRLTLVGGTVRYNGRSNRIASNGRAVCPSCGRHLPLNSDGLIRRHRTRHQDPFSPYCEAS